MKRVVDQSGARLADLAAIHVAKKALGWDDDTYRDVMFTVVRHKSSAELDFAARKAFLAHLRVCQARQGITTPAKRPQAPWGPKLRLLWSLWQTLADAKLVKDRSRAGLSAWATRQTGVDQLEWLQPAQLDLVLNSAKRWLDRKEEA